MPRISSSPRNAIINARIDEELKLNAEEIFDGLGLTKSDAITLFFKQCVIHNGLPFDLRLPDWVRDASHQDKTKTG